MPQPTVTSFKANQISRMGSAASAAAVNALTRRQRHVAPPAPLSPPGFKPAQRLDCKGAWGVWSGCAKSAPGSVCDKGKKQRTYILTQPAQNGGRNDNCPSGDVQVAQ